MKIKNISLSLHLAIIAFSTHCKPVIDFSDSELDAIAIKHGTDKASE